MALNTAHNVGGVVIYYGERILLYCDAVEFKLDSPSNVAHFKGTHKGRLYLTSHRVIFTSNNVKDMLQSFSMPFMCLKDLELEQPVFGANFIKGRCLAQPGGNWEGDAKFKLHFMHGGAIEYGQALLRAATRASRLVQNQQPPPYVSPPPTFQPAAPPMYAPPPQGYGFQLPKETFPSAPPTDGVFMYDAPPPYPGIDGDVPGAQMGSSAKAQEAAQSSAYYNPADPHNVYMPQAAPYPQQNGYYPPPGYSPYQSQGAAGGMPQQYGYSQQQPPYPTAPPQYYPAQGQGDKKSQ